MTVARGSRVQHHSAAQQVQTEETRGAGPDLTRRITTLRQHQRLVRDLSQARDGGVSRLRRARYLEKNHVHSAVQ